MGHETFVSIVTEWKIDFSITGCLDLITLTSKSCPLVYLQCHCSTQDRKGLVPVHITQWEWVMGYGNIRWASLCQLWHFSQCKKIGWWLHFMVSTYQAKSLKENITVGAYFRCQIKFHHIKLKSAEIKLNPTSKNGQGFNGLAALTNEFVWKGENGENIYEWFKSTMYMYVK